MGSLFATTGAALFSGLGVASAAPARPADPVTADSPAEGEPGGQRASRSPVQLRADFGFLGVLQHDYQQGDPGSSFDFRNEGGQDVLFPVSRYIVNVDLADRHRLSFVYQPLELSTRERLGRPILVDGTPYAAGEDLEFTYRFPFYRASYAYTAWRNDDTHLALGGGLQIRNATIEVAHVDGTNLTTERNVGPVPLLHASVWQRLGGAFWFEAEADGIYAPVKYLNGNDNGVEGAILDANVRLGIDAAPRVATFVNVRYLGGGAEGASDDGNPDDYSSNWLQFLILSLGAELH